MARKCNCRASQQITELERRYGVKPKNEKKTHSRVTIKRIFNKIMLNLIMLILIPFIFLYVMYVAIFTKDKRAHLVGKLIYGNKKYAEKYYNPKYAIR